VKKTFYILVTVLVFPLLGGAGVGLAQNKLGIANSNYSSTNSIYLNPSSSVDSRTYMQLNLVGLNVYAMTNLAYIPNFSVWQVKKTGQIETPQISDIKLKKFFYANLTVDGPAFVITKGEYGGGFFVRGRSVVDIRGIPYQITNMLLKQNPNPNVPDHIDVNLRNMKFANMTWVEYGLNFGKMIKKENDIIITAGGNLKYITGVDIMYGNLTRLKGHIDDTTVNVNEVSGKTRFNQPGWNTGSGFGLDAGITYKKMLGKVLGYFAHSKKSGCTYIDYKYKIGVSLLDFGYIRFAQNTYKGDMDGSGHINNYKKDSLKTIVAADLHTTIRYNSPIWATLPTALSAQFEWNFENHLYLNATVIKNLVPNRFTGVQSPNLISFCPRYEFKQFELAMPLTFQRFIYPQLGFAFRVRSFVLGLDNVCPLIFKKNTYGLNIYFNLGISLFKNPACRQKGQRAVNCPRDLAPVKKKNKLKNLFKLSKRRP